MKPAITVRCVGSELLPLEDLKPFQQDLKTLTKVNMGKLIRAMEARGFVAPFLCWRDPSDKTVYLVDGHQRHRALSFLAKAGTHSLPGKYPCVFVDVDNKKALAQVILYINSQYGEMNVDSLHEFDHTFGVDLKDIFGNLDLPQIDMGRFEVGFLRPDDTTGNTDPDAIPAAGDPTDPRVAPGSLWALGDHILLCGDSTNHEDVRRLMGDDKARMIFTDPPWNVAIGEGQGPARKREGIMNDNLGAKFGEFFDGWVGACLPHLSGDLYCVMSASEWGVIDASFRKRGMHFSGVNIWVKNAFVMGRSNYQKRFEPIWYGWPETAKSSFQGLRNLDDVWEYDRPTSSEEHPTMKPVELVKFTIKNSSAPGDIVFDPFMGSGTTLIAAESTGRRARGIELDPKYARVIIERWEKFTGKTAKEIEGAIK